MANPAHRHWLSWRVAPTSGPLPRPDPLPAAVRDRLAPPGSDGVRWDLVERVRAEIAAGTYDTDEKWAMAEDRLLRAAGSPDPL